MSLEVKTTIQTDLPVTPKPIKEKPPRPHKVFQVLDDSLQTFVKFLKSFAAIHTAFLGFKEYFGQALDKAEYSWINATKAIAGIGFFTGIPKLISNFQLTYRAKSAIERIEHIANSAISSGVVVGAGASLIEGLKGLGYIGKNAFKWSPLATGLFLPLQMFATELSVPEIQKTNKLRKQMYEQLSIAKKEAPRQARVEDLTRACNYIIENADDLQKALVISKKEGLQERAERILEDIRSANKAHVGRALLEGKDLAKILKARVSTKLSFKIASVAIRITAFAMSAISFAFVPISAGWIVMAAVGAIGISLLVSEKIVMHKKPITEPMSPPVYKMQQKLFHAGALVQDLWNKVPRAA